MSLIKNELEPDNRWEEIIHTAVSIYALTVFQKLNKMLNEKGLCINIDALPKKGEKK